MSDKEKLAYFLRLLDDNFTLKTYAGIELPYEELHYLTEKLAKEIEYRERVQELEKENKQLKNNLSVTQGYYKNMIKINEDIVEENKKYRKGIEKIMVCVNEHLSDGTEINPYKIDDIVDEIEGVSDV